MGKLKTIIFLHFSLLVNCISLPPTSDLRPPEIQTTLPETAVIERVAIPELSETHRKATEDNLTMNLAGCFMKGKYFKDVFFLQKKKE